MPKKLHGRIAWQTALSLVGGMSLIGWAVQDVFSWREKTALIAGVVLVAYGFAAIPHPTNRDVTDPPKA